DLSADLSIVPPPGAPDGDEAALHRLAQLAALVVRGVEVDWCAVDGLAGKLHLDLPTYAWQRQRYWLDDGPTLVPAPPGARPAHPWLAAAADAATVRFSLEAQPELADHRVHGRVVVPGAALVELAVARAAESGARAVHLAGVTLHEALVLDDGEERAVRVLE